MRGSGMQAYAPWNGKPTFIQPDGEINVSMTIVSNFHAQVTCVTTFSSPNTSLHGDPVRASQPSSCTAAFVETGWRGQGKNLRDITYMGRLCRW